MSGDVPELNREKSAFLVEVDKGRVTEHRVGAKFESRRDRANNGQGWRFVRCGKLTGPLAAAELIALPERAADDPGPWTWALTDLGRRALTAYQAAAGQARPKLGGRS
ncbi:hypothetical protein [Micromonospora sp. RV43]|uniref:hypothetical protein n=1 Tax=Micromonospora sp. RV43 TaxID=1661387 RepID=UPI00064C2BCC|nr:hypothetical protein [Micromonospora sp. RV43]